MGPFLRLLAGALLCNGIPHLVAGVQGAPFPTPFARPPGRGNSPPAVNLLWGAGNLLLGLALLSRRPAPFAASVDTALPVTGFTAMGLGLAWHFGRVRAGR